MTKLSTSMTARLRDGFVNLVNSLGTTRDYRTATQYQFNALMPDQLLQAYRSNWLAARIVDCFADDATREWRDWQASEDQIQKIEEAEKQLGLQAKMKMALIRARLFGGAGMIMGIDGAGEVNEELDLDRVTEGSLKFVLVLSSYEMSRAQMIVDATSPWFGRPEYYRINTGRADLGDVQRTITDIHPSRVIEFVGKEIPSYDVTNGSNFWGDSVLQAVDDVLKDYGTSLSTIATLINDCKIDVFTIPGLTKQIANPEYEQRLRTRLTATNTMKSSLNSMLMDSNETWQRTQTSFAGLPQVMSEMLKNVAGAAGVPMTRLVGHGSGSGKSTLGNGTTGGESDLRNYYDSVTSIQKNEITPRISQLDEVLERSVFGTVDEDVYYEWRELYTPDPMEGAQIALAKSQTFTADVTAGLINPDVLRTVRINQLVEDGFYPGLQDAVDDLGAETQEPVVGPDDVANHIAMLQQSSQQLQQIGKAAVPPVKKPPAGAADGSLLQDMRMFDI